MAIQRKTWILGLLSKIPSLVLLSGQAMTCKLHKSNLFQFVLIVSAQPGTHCSKSMELWHDTNNHLSDLHTKLIWISKQNRYMSGSELHSCIKRKQIYLQFKTGGISSQTSPLTPALLIRTSILVREVTSFWAHSRTLSWLDRSNSCKNTWLGPGTTNLVIFTLKKNILYVLNRFLNTI